MEPISHSGLTRIKVALCRQRVPPANAEFLHIGSTLHARELEQDLTHVLTQDQENQVTAMQRSLNKVPMYRNILKGAVKEVEVRNTVHGVPMFGFVDILSGTCVADIKTTSATTEREFLTSARKYGYFRQGYVYQQMTGINEFIFFVVSKKPPYPVFILDVVLYKEDMEYAKEETMFLLELYKKYPQMAAK